MGKLIEKEGQFYKECRVVMLDTDTPSKLGFLTQKGKDVFNDLRWFKGHELPKILDSVNQHIYITSDDEINDGDWFIANDGFRHDNPKYIIAKCEKVSDNGYKIYNNVGYADGYNAYKIIATTDTLLGLPQPSDKFIQAYIEAYNKGEKIEKVMVEYENKYKMKEDYPIEQVGWYNRPKLKDNTITISKVKDNWTREEMIDFAWKTLVQGRKASTSMKDLFNELPEWFDKWVEENL